MNCIVALDYKSKEEALDTVDELDEFINHYKVGLQLFLNAGLPILDSLHSRKKKIFLDLKFHDISNTMKEAMRFVFEQQVYMTTVHLSAGKQSMDILHSLKEHYKSDTNILGISVLTNLDSNDCNMIYNTHSISQQVLQLAVLAVKSQLDGIVCSVLEANTLFKKYKDALIRVCPGIQYAQNIQDKEQDRYDQKRVSSPYDAVKAHADYIVVGRSITQAENKLQATQNILAQIEESEKQSKNEKS